MNYKANHRATLIVWTVVFSGILMFSILLSWLLFEVSRLFFTTLRNGGPTSEINFL